MSKSTGNYVAVNDPPEDMFGKLMSIPDEAMGDYYLLLLGSELDSSKPPMEAKRELARRLTDRFWGEGAGEVAEARFDQVHKRREAPDEMPTVSWTDASDPVFLPALLGDAFAISRSEARRLIEQGAVRVDGEAYGELEIGREALDQAVLQAGRRRFARVALDG
jgi:tyrosyl-tRNA synthetase